MAIAIGIICACIAMIGWGVGDYLIQRTSRSLGDWETLFFISIFGAIVIYPFIDSEVAQLFVHPDMRLLFLCAASLVLLVAALLEFESLKKGKLVVVEPLYALEIPVSGLLAFFFLAEKISFGQVALVILLIIGLVLVSIRSTRLKHIFSRTGAKLWLEKGVRIAILSTICMGAVNFLFGVGARQTSALMINWFTDAFLAVACLAYLVFARKTHALSVDIMKNRWTVLTMCFFDTIAWIAFAYAVKLAPISISVALSQSYIIITILFGMFVNKENIKTHQKIGLILSIVVAILLAASF